MEAADLMTCYEGMEKAGELIDREDAQRGEPCACAHLPGFEIERRTKLSVEFVVPGEPKGKGRARSRIAKGRGGQQFVAHYTPKDTVEYENLVRVAAHEAMRGEAPTKFPVHVSISVMCGIPASWSKRKQARALADEVKPTGKPDIDNITKAILDGMNKIVVADDKLVCGLMVLKHYSHTPRVEVGVRELDGEAS